MTEQDASASVTMNFRVGDVVKYRDIETTITRITDGFSDSDDKMIFAHYSLPTMETWVRPSDLTLVTPKFEAGDRVEYTGGFAGHPDGYSVPEMRGKTGTVIEVGPRNINIDWDENTFNGRKFWGVYPENLTRIALAEDSQEEIRAATEEKRTPQIGDRVRVTSTYFPTNNVGREGWFVADDKDSQPYVINFTANRSIDEWGNEEDDYCYATGIEVVEETPIIPEGYVRAEDVYRTVEQALINQDVWSRDRGQILQALESIGVKKPEPSTSKILVTIKNSDTFGKSLEDPEAFVGDNLRGFEVVAASFETPQKEV